jgi:hypothetical protein
LVAGHLGKQIQVAYLLLKVFTGTVKPEALTCTPVNAQWSTDGITIPAGPQSIVLGEDFDAFLPTPLDRDTQPQGKTASVDAAIPRWKRLRQEYPEMPAPMAVLKCRLHSVLPEVEAELEEVCERILIICVDGHPLRALCCRIDGVKADGDFAFEVTADCVQRQAEALTGFRVLGAVVVMTVTFRTGPVGLEGVSAPVYEEVEVIHHHTGGRFETEVLHLLLLQPRWMGPLLHVGCEMMRIFCHMDRFGRRNKLIAPHVPARIPLGAAVRV